MLHTIFKLSRSGDPMNVQARIDLNLPAVMAVLLLSGVSAVGHAQANPGSGGGEQGGRSGLLPGTPGAGAPDASRMATESGPAVSQPSASPLPESSRSTRPGRSGRDAGNRLQPQRQETIGDQPAQPDAQKAPQPTEPAGQPIERPAQEAADQPQPPPPAQTVEQEREQRRRRMELQQQQAEEAERLRREERYRQMMQDQQEALGKQGKEGRRPNRAE
jgi:hypothetical protein